MSEKSIFIEDIGTVKFRKNKQSKRISIAIRPMQGVIVTFPFYVSYKYALSVVHKKKPWIVKHLPKIKDLEKKSTIYSEETEFYTKYRKLIIAQNHEEVVKAKITHDSIIIHYPSSIAIENPKLQAIVKNSIVKALRIEAKEYLPLRTDFLSSKYNFEYNKIFIKNNKTLWGSCSSVNNINLNLHLMRLPDHLIDYVIIHELCHTVEKNHGKRFWQLMDSLLGDSKKLSKEVRNYSLQIY